MQSNQFADKTSCASLNTFNEIQLTSAFEMSQVQFAVLSPIKGVALRPAEMVSEKQWRPEYGGLCYV